MQQALQKIPAKVRAALYMGWGLVTLAMTAWASWYTTVGEVVPDLVLRMTGVVAVFGAAFLFTAAGNTEVEDTSGGSVQDAIDNLNALEELESEGLEIPETDESPSKPSEGLGV